MRPTSVLMAAGLFLAAGAAAAQAHDPGWYLGVSAGPGQGSTLDQEGWNQDTFCYPDNACFDQDPRPSVSGYRWFYDLDPDSGAAFELFAGRVFSRTRLELSLAQQRNSASQNFTGLSFYDDSPIVPRPGGTVNSNSRSSIGALVVQSLMLNGYYDFPFSWGGFSPYVGIGAGFANMELTDTYFSTNYADSAGGDYDPPLSFYNSSQSADFDDQVFAWALHAGADLRLSGPVLLGLKLTWLGTGNFEHVGGYLSHPMHTLDPDFTNTNISSGARNLTLRLTIKRRLGG